MVTDAAARLWDSFLRGFVKDFFKDYGGSFVMGTGERKFRPGQLVLVRGGGPESIDPRVWRVGVFSFQRAVPDGGVGFFTGTGVYHECIPLEGNESLVGSARPFGGSPSKGQPTDTPSDGGPVSSYDDDFATSGGDSVRAFGALRAEIEALRSTVSEKSILVKKLEAKVCRVESEKSELLERCRDLEASRCGIEDNIVALLSAGKDRSAGDFIKRVVAENRVNRGERMKLLEERDRLLEKLAEAYRVVQVGRVVEETDGDAPSQACWGGQGVD